MKIERLINKLGKDGYAAFGGEDPVDEVDKELLIAFLENSMCLAKRMAKQKFTPNKYRKQLLKSMDIKGEVTKLFRSIKQMTHLRLLNSKKYQLYMKSLVIRMVIIVITKDLNSFI